MSASTLDSLLQGAGGAVKLLRNSRTGPYVYPVVAILVDYVYFGRVLSATQIAGGVLVLSAGLCSTLNVRLQSVLPLRAEGPSA